MGSAGSWTRGIEHVRIQKAAVRECRVYLIEALRDRSSLYTPVTCKRTRCNAPASTASRLRLWLQIFSERDGLTRLDQHIHDPRLVAGGSKLETMGAGTELDARR